MNSPLHRSERSTILPRSEGKKNAQDRLFLLLINSPAAPGHAHSRSPSLCHHELCRPTPGRCPHAAGLCFILCQAAIKTGSKKQNLINFTVRLRYNPSVSTTAYTAGTFCLRGRHLFQIQIKLCFFTENPPIFFTSLKDP